MTEASPVAAAGTEPRLFDALRADPKKSSEGIWLTHPRTRDRFLAKRRNTPEYWRVWFEALQDYEARHGKDSQLKAEAQQEAEAIAMATAVVIDWKLHQHPDLPYSRAKMAAALADPELRQDLLVWLIMETDGPTNFRPDAIAGN